MSLIQANLPERKKCMGKFDILTEYFWYGTVRTTHVRKTFEYHHFKMAYWGLLDLLLQLVVCVQESHSTAVCLCTLQLCESLVTFQV